MYDRHRHYFPKFDDPFAGAAALGLHSRVQVAQIPEISAAFDEFSRKALCQESVLFLKAVRV